MTGSRESSGTERERSERRKAEERRVANLERRGGDRVVESVSRRLRPDRRREDN